MEPYKIKILFGQRRGSYIGEFAPEILFAVDEYTDDTNPDYFRNQMGKIKSEVGSEMINMQVIEIEIPREEIDKILNPDVIKLAKISKNNLTRGGKSV